MQARRLQRQAAAHEKSRAARNGLRNPNAQMSGAFGAGAVNGFPAGVIAANDGGPLPESGSAETSSRSTLPPSEAKLGARHGSLSSPTKA